jgi:hypothetical protein
MKERTMWHSAIGCLVTLTLGLLTAPLAADAQPAGSVPGVTGHCTYPEDAEEAAPSDRVKVLLGTAVVIVLNPAMDIELQTFPVQGQRLRQQILVTNYSDGDVTVQIQPGGAGPPTDSICLGEGESSPFTPPTEGVKFWVVTVTAR